jgi:hypothetical protein
MAERRSSFPLHQPVDRYVNGMEVRLAIGVNRRLTRRPFRNECLADVAVKIRNYRERHRNAG